MKLETENKQKEQNTHPKKSKMVFQRYSFFALKVFNNIRKEKQLY